MPNAPHKSINNAFRCALIALAAACPLLAHAQNQWLNTTGDNLYSNPANWSLNTVPLTGDILFESTPGPLTLDTSPTIAIANINTDIFLNMAANPLNANYLKIASTPSSTGSLTINEADNVYLSNSSYITFGRDATGALTVTGPNTAIQLGRLSFNGYETDHLGRAVRVPGHGTLTVNNGATITITKPDSPSLHMITDFGSTHRANLDGPNSSIQIIEEGQIILGNDDPQNTPNGSAILNIQNGASLLAPLSDTLLLTGGTINLINGTLQTAEFNNSGGTFNWTAGTLHITQSPVTLAPDQPLGNSLTIDATKTLDVRGLQPQENTLRIGNIDNSPTHLNITAGGSVYANTAELIDNANITLSGDNALLHVDFLSFESPDDPAHTQRLLIENGATVDSEAIRVFAGDITIGPGGTINAIRKTLTPNTTYGTGFEFYDRYSSIPKSLTLSGGTLNAESFTLETGVVNIQSGEMNIAHPDENSNTDQLGINLRTEAQFNFSGGHITTDFFNMGVPATPYLPPYLNWTGGELTIQSRTIFQYDESNSLVSSLYGSLSMGSGMHLNVEKELLVRYGSNFGNPNNPVMRFDILDGATVQANAMLIGDPLDATSLISTPDEQLPITTIGGTDSTLTVGELHVGGAMLVEDLTSSPDVFIYANGSGRLDILFGGLVTAQSVQVGGVFSEYGSDYHNRGILNLLGGTLQTADFQIASPYIDSNSDPSNPTTIQLGIFNFTSGRVQLLGDQSIASYQGLGLALTTSTGNVTLKRGQTVAVQNNLTLQTPLTLDGGTLETGSLSGASLLDFQSGTLHLTASDINFGSSSLFPQTTTLNNNQTLITNQTANTPIDALLIINAAALHAEQINNQGEIQLNNPLATLNAQLLNNQGLITGHGRINAPSLNTTTGQIRNDSTQQLTINTIENAGDIHTINSPIQFNSHTINSPTGRIFSRNGTLDFRAALQNQGLLALTYGTHDIFGPINNQPDASIIVTGASQATFYDDIANNGTIRISDNSSAVFFGTLSGAGQITGGPNAKLYIEGGLSPGNSPGALTIETPLTLSPTSTLNIEIAGPNPGQFDQLFLTTATLAGALNIDLLNGYRPYIGETFDILTFDQILGDFTNITGAYIDQTLALVPIWSEHTLQLAATLPGDFNLDGQIDVADLSTWATGFAIADTFQTGDANLDGQVDVNDLSTWATNFGLVADEINALTTSSAATSIPEPSALALLALTASLISMRRNKLATQKQR